MHLSKQAWLLSGLILSAPVFAQIDTLHGGVVTQSTFSTRYGQLGTNASGVKMVPDPAVAVPTATTRSVMLVNLRDTDAAVQGVRRSDVYPLNEYMRTSLRWYGMSVYFPATWEFDVNPTIVAQIDTTQSTVKLLPPVAVVARGNALELNLNANFRPIAGTVPATQANSSTQVVALDTLTRGKWYCFIVRSDWSPTLGTGATTMWMNGIKVYDATRSYNSYETTIGNVPRVGLVAPGAMAVRSRSLYMDFVTMGGPVTNIWTLLEQMPCPVPTTVSR